MNHSYPRDLALILAERWGDLLAGGLDGEPLPELSVLEDILSVCYQASLMRDENRPVRFRIMLCVPERLPAEDGPPMGLHRLVFTRPRPFDEHELRRLSHAAAYERALIGVRACGPGGTSIWGLVQSGSRWLYSITGGRGDSPLLPPCLCVSASAPGRLEVFMGEQSIGRIEGGRISSPMVNVFASSWLSTMFSEIRAEIMALHETARASAGGAWARVQERVLAMAAQHVIKRLISVIRNSQHGGTLVILPVDTAEEVFLEDRYIYLKYKFVEEEPRRRFRTLVLRTLAAVAEEYGGRYGQQYTVTPADYVSCVCGKLADLDEALFELSNLAAALAAVDGAVVISKRFDIIGFGGEISGDLPSVLQVARARDNEGREVEPESAEGVGTRHRSAYRLCNSVPDALAIVVSQDGEVRFVARRDGQVIYWEHQATGS